MVETFGVVVMLDCERKVILVRGISPYGSERDIKNIFGFRGLCMGDLTLCFISYSLTMILKILTKHFGLLPALRLTIITRQLMFIQGIDSNSLPLI